MKRSHHLDFSTSSNKANVKANPERKSLLLRRGRENVFLPDSDSIARRGLEEEKFQEDEKRRAVFMKIYNETSTERRRDGGSRKKATGQIVLRRTLDLRGIAKNGRPSSQRRSERERPEETVTRR